MAKKKRKGNQLKSYLQGSILYSGGAKKIAPMLLVIFAGLILCICVRYNNELQLIQIAELKQEQKDMKLRMLSRHAILLEGSRESNILKEIEKNKIDLELALQPPYIIDE
ncbi:MAG: FtsL-like putative cell division protein [Bacteroidaceae bacterium]